MNRLVLFFTLFSFGDCLAQVGNRQDTIAIGSLKDGFKSVIDQDEPLPNWADHQFDQMRSRYYRLFQVKPTYLIADFTGDQVEDIALFVNRISDDKGGVIFLFKNDEPVIIGAGNQFGAVGDDFKWADSWTLFDEKVAFEITFKENGNVLGNKEVQLEHPAISIREDEGSGGLIYFNGAEFVWIHQGD